LTAKNIKNRETPPIPVLNLGPKKHTQTNRFRQTLDSIPRR
jgi:hypothetical protein